MSLKEKFNKALNEMLTPEQKTELTNIFKFNAPVLEPNNNAAPAVDPNAPPAPDLALEDGTVIKIDTPTLMEGSMIMVITPEGELPAPDGTHKLKTGEVIEVAGGKVTKLTPVAVDPNAPNVSAEMAALTESQNKLTADLAQANQIIKALTSKFESQEKEIKEVKEKFMAFGKTWEEILEMPTEEPLKTPENKFANATDKKADKLKSFNKAKIK